MQYCLDDLHVDNEDQINIQQSSDMRGSGTSIAVLGRSLRCFPMVGGGVGSASRGGGGGGGTSARMEARRVARQMTVDFVTINYDGVSGGEDDSSISSSSRSDLQLHTYHHRHHHHIIITL